MTTFSDVIDLYVDEYGEMIADTVSKYYTTHDNNGDTWLLMCNPDAASMIGPVKRDRETINKLCDDMGIPNVAQHVWDAPRNLDADNIMLLLFTNVGVFTAHYKLTRK